MVFPTTPRKSARDWFNSPSPGSIYSFNELSITFCSYSVVSKKRKETFAHLLSISMAKEKKLMDYINRFNLERFDVEDCSDDIAISAFTNDLRDMDLVRLLYKKQLQSFDDVMTRVKTYMLVNETLHSLGDEAKNPATRFDKKAKHGGESNERKMDQPRTPLPPSRQYTLLNRPHIEVLNFIRKEGYVNDPPHMRTKSTDHWRGDLSCRFYRDYGHDIENCYRFKEEIERLISRGHLRRLLAREQPCEEIRETKMLDDIHSNDQPQ